MKSIKLVTYVARTSVNPIDHEKSHIKENYRTLDMFECWSHALQNNRWNPENREARFKQREQCQLLQDIMLPRFKLSTRNFEMKRKMSFTLPPHTKQREQCQLLQDIMLPRFKLSTRNFEMKRKMSFTLPPHTLNAKHQIIDWQLGTFKTLHEHFEGQWWVRT